MIVILTTNNNSLVWRIVNKRMKVKSKIYKKFFIGLEESICLSSWSRWLDIELCRTFWPIMTRISSWRKWCLGSLVTGFWRKELLGIYIIIFYFWYIYYIYVFIYIGILCLVIWEISRAIWGIRTKWCWNLSIDPKTGPVITCVCVKNDL